MLALETLLEESIAHHGHKCPGQVLGVRMAKLGCTMLDIEKPKESKKLIVYVEIDRCVTDAILAVTGCKLGRRTLKYIDLGKVAATFLNLENGDAFRIVAKDDSRERSWRYVDADTDKKTAQLIAYKIMPDRELFNVMRVHVDVKPQDMPGHPIARVKCELCHEGVNDRREVIVEEKVLCASCAKGAYYLVQDTIETRA